MNLQVLDLKEENIKKHFGSIENLKLASLDDLKKIKSIPKTILEKIYEYFHSV